MQKETFNLADVQNQLVRCIAEYKSCAVALSGGVDSAVVAKAAQLALGEHSVAVTSVSPSLPEGELEASQKIAELIGIRHEIVRTKEYEDKDYIRNATDRCYHCKSHLYDNMQGLAEQLNVAVICNGANADDTGDHRPGMQAAAERKVRSPLLECDINKKQVRMLAESWSLPVWDKPAAPCLASRVAYGEEVTPERLQRIDQAEQFLRSFGLVEIRVRLHKDELARIEVSASDFPKLAEKIASQNIVKRFQELGFKYITLDLQGFRSGSLNSVIPVDELRILN